MITDIQRFSLNDGPGIRTTVFFKGCPLRCEWCHNPEAVRFERELMLYPEKCIGCGACAKVCPAGARRITEGRLCLEPEKCVNCFRCADVCFTGAIQISGTEMSARAIVGEVLKDLDYYRNSGGGVTLSGGEVLASPELAKAVLDGCHAAGISTAVETSLCVPWETAREVLERVDLIMADIKLADCGEHKRRVGAENTRILENIRNASRLGIPMILRTPVIPGVNDREEAISAIAEIAAGLDNVLYYELLNYNPLGESKYRALGKEYPLAGTKPLSGERMEALRKAALARGLKEVRIG